jgi:lipopolysaccharide export system protein LptA
VQFELWPTGFRGAQERRSLEAKAATFRFDEQGRLASIQGHGDVLLRRSTGPSGVVADELRCGALIVGLDPASGEIVDGEFITNVVVSRGRQKATAGRALYAKSELVLLEEPEVVDPDAGLRIVAERIGLGVGPNQGEISATGHVRKTLKRSGDSPRGLLDAPEIVVQCEALKYSITRGAALYRIDALLRAGSDEVQAHQIQVREVDGQRRLVAKWKVRAVLRVSEGDPAGSTLVHASARDMHYEGATGTLKFAGAVEVRHKDLAIATPESVKIQLRGSTMEDLVAGETQVNVSLAERQASGAQAHYLPAEGKLEIEGARVVYQDAKGKLRGRKLTLLRQDDRIQVDGKDVQRTGMTIRRGGPQQ